MGKMGSDSVNLISSGKSFQSFGARMEKALSPLVMSLDTGRNSSLLPEDLRLRDCTYGTKSCEIYAGAKSCRALKVINKILKSILKQMGSQCRDARTGVIWSYFLDLVKSLAAEFW